MASTYALIAFAFLAMTNVVFAQNSTTKPQQPKKEFPLVWVCLGVTVVGIGIALYVAYRRPDELHLPGSTVMVSKESEEMKRINEPTTKNKLEEGLEEI
ncbi:hypothetical protein C3747_202g310c [Trypanosoma cruzi]|uniref:Transmembrane protein n=2 Tax=Trypanosoma cruzi TaxID=5693 RepID=Q4DFT3_TRYCC|nr:hypothetical protein, conserved [Trypanosoma cruzi]EAN91388.1 hypothetical protein, conserved [Trypanosoma cruzi]KAF8300285.1 hypothetical protein TcYC6_0061740 [Trypanosoma cruzi]PWV00932.1 hypothetical protein C3747_202g310c [Trypanosoma cruzi]|eukprot:XP_813239.1 hypothetical protein [Trypanosoma cruzi strain CL Brener]